MNKFLQAIDGHKTHILAAFGVLLWVGMVFNLWTMDQVKELLALLVSLGALTLRDAIKKAEK